MNNLQTTLDHARRLLSEAVSNCAAYTVQGNIRQADRMDALIAELKAIISSLEMAGTAGTAGTK